MRFLVKLKAQSEAKVPLDYRRRFISFLKVVFGVKLISSFLVKPYTFAVYFGRDARLRGEFIEGVKFINFRFSTGDYSLAVNFYNRVLELKAKNYKHRIGEYPFKVEGVRMERERRPSGRFKTLSPVIVERKNFSSKKPTERFVLPWEGDFEEALLENLKRRYEGITGRPFRLSFFKFVAENLREEFIRHYGGYLRGFIGTFKLEADFEILDFVYKYGMGLRTGQGFGYLEVA